MTDGAKWERKNSTYYVWQKTRADHPKNFIPAKAKKHKDRCAEWISAQNINDWIDIHKKYIFDIGFVKNVFFSDLFYSISQKILSQQFIASTY